MPFGMRNIFRKWEEGAFKPQKPLRLSHSGFFSIREQIWINLMYVLHPVLRVVPYLCRYRQYW